MMFFYLLLIVLIFLIILTIFSSIIKFSLLLTTRHKYNTSVLLVPSILNIISWSIIFYIWSIAIVHVTGKDIFTIIFDNILNISSLRETILAILPITLIFIFIGITLQSFSFFSVNIPYNKIKNRFKIVINKLFKVKIKINNEEKGLVLNEGEEELNIVNSFIASIFTFSLTFFLIIVCYSIGNILSNKLLMLLEQK